MKKCLLLLSFFFLLLSTSLKAQNEPEFEVKSNLLAIRYSNFNAGYEHFLTPYASVEVYAGVSIPSVLFEPSFSSYYLRPEIRYYSARKNVCSGLFTGVYLNFRSRSDAYYSDTTAQAIALNQSVFGMCVGLNIGYKTIFRDDFSLALNLGLGRYFYAVGSETGQVDIAKYDEEANNLVDIFDLRLGINLGYRFKY